MKADCWPTKNNYKRSAILGIILGSQILKYGISMHTRVYETWHMKTLQMKTLLSLVLETPCLKYGCEL
jgi:hypothetical protein